MQYLIFRAQWLELFKKIELLSNFVLSFFNIGEISECDFACIDDGNHASRTRSNVYLIE